MGEQTKIEWTHHAALTKRQRGALRVFPAASKGGEMPEWPEDLRVREFPKGLR